MADSRSVADSHAWENKCKQLLAIRYRDELQIIDATRSGDLGLEAFTRDSACGFQCYAAVEPLSVQQLYRKQRDKLTTDLNKLVANETELAVILGTTKLRRYVFMVPRFDPPLLTQCGRKAQEMRAKGLSILAPDFDIVVHTEENYPAERAQLVELALEPLRLSIRDVAHEERMSWATAHEPLIATLTGKIRKLGTTSQEQSELRDQFLDHFLRREELLHQISNEAPDTRVRIEQRIRDREHLLASARLMADSAPREHARTVIEGLAAELLVESKALQSTGAEALAWGTAADWLIRCPLDF